ncbi:MULTISPECIES: 23S rRNA pseudouridine(955/2504/2580) synthase RluC [unclassified Ketobacter]|uniref:23S rRNA pseudouridine(955/2504/2580) synthase RluC n=1 Tax=unclassified Ketobacter TaxID=2639109 RepID=UPI000F19F487|nr:MULTISPECIES: 23S rRNA pseudouridine(955/2504/2580) synthase RluC [unclassified Ketobacter]RLT89938.1 MAG: 23S rRNA pseudouridine(955/2504/2580) synthase RluC [Ketobacter sp. GenoA1]RLT98949.1 MAG: 23S rRNA pseudouridine(955/2504/2580) synthase RluC [Ketobacter sp.]
MSSNDKRPSVAMVTVTEDQFGQRLDNFLMTRLKGVPKSAIYRMIRKGEVRVNKGRTKPDYKLQQGDLVRVPPARTKEVSASTPFVGDSLKSQLESAILYEDDGLIVLNKPSGLAVHGGSGVSLGVIEALRQIRPGQRFLELVHRLDRDTSGCLMVAKKRSVLKKLHEDLRLGAMQKTYLALLWGRWSGLEHRIEAPLRKFHLASGERVVRVSADGKPSLTLFRQLELYEQATLVEARPITGRTHQIRVHAQHAGHPIAGDDKYLHREQAVYFEERGLKRLFLHAASLELQDLDGNSRLFEAPLPPELSTFLSRL